MSGGGKLVKPYDRGVTSSTTSVGVAGIGRLIKALANACSQ